MSNTDKLEGGNFSKFLVLKANDVRDYLTEDGVDKITEICEYIGVMREQEGKARDNQYLVINTEEPYAHEVIDILKRNGHWG